MVKTFQGNHALGWGWYINVSFYRSKLIFNFTDMIMQISHNNVREVYSFQSICRGLRLQIPVRTLLQFSVATVIVGGGSDFRLSNPAS